MAPSSGPLVPEYLPVPGFLIQGALQVMRSAEVEALLPVALRDFRPSTCAQTEPGTFSLSRSDFLALQEVLGQLSEKVPIGLLIGEKLTEPNLHVLGPIIVASRTIREAFARCDALLRDMQCLPRSRLEEGEREVRYRAPERNLGPLWEDLVVSLAFHMAQRFVKGALPTGIWSPHLFTPHFARPEPNNLEDFERCFGHTPVFNSDMTGLVFSRSLLDLPRPGTDPALAAELQQIVKRRLPRQVSQKPWTARLESALAERGDLASVDFGQLAAAWGISHRALRRQLTAEGESTLRVLERVRHTRARYYLSETSASLTEVAQVLGYADATSLRRAVKRWTGLTPQAYRAKLTMEP